MSNSAPAAASLLAQQYSHPSGMASSSSSSPSSILSSSPAQDPALQQTALSNVDTTTKDLYKVDRSWMETFAGQVGSIRRDLSWLIFSTVLMTVVRNACFDKRVFGNYLLHTLAPIERDSVTWRWIFITRIWEMCLVSFVWKRVRGGLKREGALFGLVYALVSRSGLYMFEHSYFLLSSGAPFTLLLIDCLAFLVTLSFLPTFHPSPPSARAPLGILRRLEADPALLYNLAFAIGLVTFSTAFGSYAVERLGGSQYVKENTWDVEIPAYLMKDQLTGTQMMEHPTIHVPTLRLTPPVSMSTHLLHSLLSTLPILALTSFLPTLSPLVLSILSFLIVSIPSTTLLNDIFPIKLSAAAGVGITLGLKGFAAAGMYGWILEQLRNSLLVVTRVSRKQGLIVENHEGREEDEIVGIVEEEVVEEEVVEDREEVDRVVEEAHELKSQQKKKKGGVVKRKGLGGAGTEVDA